MFLAQKMTFCESPFRSLDQAARSVSGTTSRNVVKASLEKRTDRVKPLRDAHGTAP